MVKTESTGAEVVGKALALRLRDVAIHQLLLAKFAITKLLIFLLHY